MIFMDISTIHHTLLHHMVDLGSIKRQIARPKRRTLAVPAERDPTERAGDSSILPDDIKEQLGGKGGVQLWRHRVYF